MSKENQNNEEFEEFVEECKEYLKEALVNKWMEVDNKIDISNVKEAAEAVSKMDESVIIALTRIISDLKDRAITAEMTLTEAEMDNMCREWRN